MGYIHSDDQLDTVVSNEDTYSTSFLVGHGNGSFADQISFPVGSNSHTKSVVFGNVNNDTRVDISVDNNDAAQ